jgi:DNA-binding Lrp family transcriptional regulator
MLYNVANSTAEDRTGTLLAPEEPPMIKAYVLVVTDPGKTRHVHEEISKIPNIVELHEVMGPYDLVVEIEVESLQDIPTILGERIRTLDGIQSTTSLVTLPD